MKPWWLVCVVGIGGTLAGQGGLDQAAARARSAWLAHDPAALLAGSPGVTLEIPGADPSSAIGRDQAGELLGRYLRTSQEHSVDVRVAREMAEGQGFVELERRFTVAGTTEQRHETVFLGLRRRGDQWVVVELRTGR
ncbi:MAG TPA: hypothetical protein VKB63_11850 [Gemmatimonadales bacterium]|nr:hypothetical protein [Gemmatimonadales bacterium]